MWRLTENWVQDGRSETEMISQSQSNAIVLDQKSATSGEKFGVRWRMTRDAFRQILSADAPTTWIFFLRAIGRAASGGTTNFDTLELAARQLAGTAPLHVRSGASEDLQIVV